MTPHVCSGGAGPEPSLRAPDLLGTPRPVCPGYIISWSCWLQLWQVTRLSKFNASTSTIATTRKKEKKNHQTPTPKKINKIFATEGELGDILFSHICTLIHTCTQTIDSHVQCSSDLAKPQSWPRDTGNGKVWLRICNHGKKGEETWVDNEPSTQPSSSSACL